MLTAKKYIRNRIHQAIEKVPGVQVWRHRLPPASQTDFWCLVCYERKVLLPNWWLVIDADLVREKSTAGWLTDKPSEQSE